MVLADSRFAASEVFLEYNAFKCVKPDCKVLLDGHCKACNMTRGVCTVCDEGYFVDEWPADRFVAEQAMIDRAVVGSELGQAVLELARNEITQRNSTAPSQELTCQLCSSRFPHCLTCSSTECLACDAAFGLRRGRCVSDGSPQFSALEYQAYRNQSFLDLEISHSDARVRVETIGLSARAGVDFLPISLELGTLGTLPLSIADLEIPVLSPPCVRKSMIRIPILESGGYSEDVRSFKVKLQPESRALSGTASPFSMQPIGNMPFQPVTEATVYIWDYGHKPLVSMEISSLDFPTEFKLGSVSLVEVIAKGCAEEKPLGRGCASVADLGAESDERIIVTTEPAIDVALGDAVLSLSLTEQHAQFSNFTLGGYFIPFVAAPFAVGVKRSINGVQVTQMADLSRTFRPMASGSYEASVSISGWLHTGCVDGEILEIGVSVSGGSMVSLKWRNAGRVVELVGDSGVAGLLLPEQATSNPLSSALSPYACGGNSVCFSVAPVDEDDVLTGMRVFRDRTIGGVVRPALHPFQLDFTPNPSVPPGQNGLRFFMRSTPNSQAWLRDIQPVSRADDGMPIISGLLTNESNPLLSPSSPVPTEPIWFDVPRSCLFTGSDVVGSPLLGLVAVAGSPSAETSRIGSGVAVSVNAGSFFVIAVVLKDKAGNTVTDPEYATRISVSLDLPSGPVGAASIIFDRKFLIRIDVPGGTPLLTTTLRGWFDSVELVGSPVSVSVKAAASSALHSTVAGNFSTIEVDKRTCFVILSADEAGNRRVDGGDDYGVLLSGPEGAERPAVTLSVTDLSDGSYEVCMRVLISGRYALAILLGGLPIPGSPFAVSVEGAVEAGASEAIGLSVFSARPVIAGRNSTFGIRVKDKYGQLYLNAASLSLNLEISPPATASSQAQGADFSVTWSTCSAGRSNISISVAGATVKGSPFRVEVVPGEASGKNSQLGVLTDSLSAEFRNVSSHILRLPVGVAAFGAVAAFDECGNKRYMESEFIFKLIRKTRFGDFEKPVWSDLVKDADRWISSEVLNLGVLAGSGFIAPTAFRLGNSTTIALSPGDPVFAILPEHAGEYTLNCLDPDGSVCEGFDFVAYPIDHAEPGNLFAPGKVGPSELTTTGSPLIQSFAANETFEISVIPKGSDETEIDGQTPLVYLGLWRADQCPDELICGSFGSSQACGSLPGCIVTPSGRCAPSCDSRGPEPVRKTTTGNFQFRITESGTYRGIPVITKPGAVAASWFDVSTVDAIASAVAFDAAFSTGNLLCESLEAAPISETVPPCLARSDGRGFGLRLISRFRPPSSGSWLLVAEANCEYGKIYIDERLVSGALKTHGNLLLAGPIELEEAKLYSLRIEMLCLALGLSGTSPAKISLSWESEDLEFDLIPADALFWTAVALPEFSYTRVIRAKLLAKRMQWTSKPSVGTSGESVVLNFRSQDEFGNTLEAVDTEAVFAVAVTPALPTSLIALPDGSYDVTILPAVATEYELDVTLQSTGFTLTSSIAIFPGLADSLRSTVQCSPKDPVAGSIVACALILADPAGNVINSQETLYSLFLTSPGGVRMEGMERITISGTWSASAAYPNGTVFKTDTFTVSPGLADPAMVERSAISSSPAVSGTRTASFSITAKDEFGNQLVSGGNKWLVEFIGPSRVVGQVADLGNGAYDVTATLLADRAINWRTEISMVNQTGGETGLTAVLAESRSGAKTRRNVVESLSFSGFDFVSVFGYLWSETDRLSCTFSVTGDYDTTATVTVDSLVIWEDEVLSSVDLKARQLTSIQAEIAAPPGWTGVSENVAEVLWSCDGDPMSSVPQEVLIHSVIPISRLSAIVPG